MIYHIIDYIIFHTILVCDSNDIFDGFWVAQLRWWDLFRGPPPHRIRQFRGPYTYLILQRRLSHTPSDPRGVGG